MIVSKFVDVVILQVLHFRVLRFSNLAPPRFAKFKGSGVFRIFDFAEFCRFVVFLNLMSAGCLIRDNHISLHLYILFYQVFQFSGFFAVPPKWNPGKCFCLALRFCKPWGVTCALSGRRDGSRSVWPTAGRLIVQLMHRFMKSMSLIYFAFL
jgi:hypothetical protein